ncbi:MAG: 5'-nucleotidase C-terminal domain-containing protein [Bradymonadaceae bacterium]|nr:5'-nucleotidase C-terminal domain-containing protein [Lujinxingiaceae bacterium]
MISIFLCAPALAQPLEEAPEQPAEAPASSEEGEQADAVEEAQPKPTQPRSNHRHLRFLLTANIDGRFAQPNCRAPEIIADEDLFYAQQASVYQTLDSLSGSEGMARPIALNAGDTIFPGPIARYLLSQGRPGMRNLMHSLVQIPYEAHALGNREFSVPRAELLGFLEAANATHLRTQAANLRCAEFSGAEAICESVGTFAGGRPFVVTERAGLRVSITSVVDPGVFRTVGREQTEGLELLDPLEMLAPLVNSMRQESNLVVVQLHVRESNAVQAAHSLASQVPGIDLLIVNHLLDTSGTERPSASAAVIRAQGTGTYIVSADSGHRSVITLSVHMARDENEGALWHVRDVEPRVLDTRDMPPRRETAQILTSVAQAYCDDWGRPITTVPLEKAFELSDLQRYVLNTMRFATRSEVALINRRAFRNEEQFPLTGELSLADIHTALPFNNMLATVDVSGAVLAALGPRIGTELIAAGLEVVDGKLLINGRAPSPDRRYRIATNDFLAQGGDSVFTPAQLHNVQIFHPEWSAAPPTLSAVAIEYISSGRYAEGGKITNALSPDGNFPDLYRQFLWTLTGSLNASYHKVSVHNPVVLGALGYDQSQLTVNSTDQINLEGRIVLRADSRNHGWDNDAVLQFATARVADEADVGFQETKDLIRLRSQYRYQGFRADLGGRWFVPSPLAELQLETEFDPPETRLWRRMDLRAILGVSFLLAAPLEFKIGANARHDLNAPDAEATYGLNLGYKLRRISLLTLLGRPIQFESEVEYFYNDIAAQNIQELRSGNRLFFAVFDQFFFTTTFNAFLYRTDAVGEFGTNTELTIGLNYLWDYAHQSF